MLSYAERMSVARFEPTKTIYFLKEGSLGSKIWTQKIVDTKNCAKMLSCAERTSV